MIGKNHLFRKRSWCMCRSVRVIVNAEFLYKTVNIVCVAYKNNIIGGFVSWNDNVFAVKVS